MLDPLSVRKQSSWLTMHPVSGGQERETQIGDYVRRGAHPGVTGRGFDSPRLHQS